MKRLVVGILGYGCQLTPGVKQYLDRAIDYIKVNQARISHVILTGGFTNPVMAPGVSEAQMMAEYLCSQGVALHLSLEEGSISTLENIEAVRDRVNTASDTLILFCDTSRRFKVAILSRVILGYLPIIKGYDVCNSSHKEKLFQSTIATLGELLAYKYPLARQFLLDWRRRKN